MAKAQDKGEALRKRVVALFSNAFKNKKITPSKKNGKEDSYFLTPDKVLFRKIDVTVKNEKNYWIVLECKNVKNKPTISDIASRIRDIKKDKNAKGGLIVISGCKISQK